MSKSDKNKKSKSKKYRDSLKCYVPLHPLMPREYSAIEREKLRKYEAEIMKHNIDDIGREPGE